MKNSEKLARKGKTMVTIATVAEFIVPIPFIWSGLKKKGGEMITTSKLFNVEGLAQLLVDTCEDDPNLMAEFWEEIKVANENPEIIAQIVREAMEKRQKNKTSKDEEKE